MEGPEDQKARLDVTLLEAEVKGLYAEIDRLQQEIHRLRNSTVFRLRQRLLPEGSSLQRLFLAVRKGEPQPSVSSVGPTYSDWCERWDTLSLKEREAIQREIAAWSAPPRFSLIVLADEHLEGAIASGAAQLYANWELCIVADPSLEPRLRATLARRGPPDTRIKVHLRPNGQSRSAALNEAIAMSTGDYVAFLAPGDVLPEHALFTFARYAQSSPEAKLLYCDEDRIDSSGKRSGPYFKPDWDPLLHLSRNYVSPMAAFRADVGRSLGWARAGFEGEEEWDLALRVTEAIPDSQILHIPHILCHRRLPNEEPGEAATGSKTTDRRAPNLNPSPPREGSASLRTGGEGPLDVEKVAIETPRGQEPAGVNCVTAALERRGEPAIVDLNPAGGLVRVSFQIPEPPPRVSVIIPTRDRIDLLAKCLDSMLSITDYPDYEVVIVDNGSIEPATMDYFAALAGFAKIRVVRVDAPFNYAALNNRGAAAASGQMLALLNNDIEIVAPDWMDRLTALAARPGFGAVGARLLYPDGRVQHGGVILGFEGLTGHDYGNSESTIGGDEGRLWVDRCVTAVTGACLFVRREHYEAVGGLDEKFAVTFNDIDMCLKLRERGLRNVYAGTVTCIHHESASRRKHQSPESKALAALEALRFRSRWESRLQRDPFYNPNLSLSRQTHDLADPPRVSVMN